MSLFQHKQDPRRHQAPEQSVFFRSYQLPQAPVGATASAAQATVDPFSRHRDVGALMV